MKSKQSEFIAKPLFGILLYIFILSPTWLMADENNWQKNPGDFSKAAEQLEKTLKKSFPDNIFKHFFAFQRVDHEPRNRSKVSHDTAEQILSLYRMGKISANTDGVQRAYAYMFLTKFLNMDDGFGHGRNFDPSHQHEVLNLYEEIAVKNSGDPTLRILRALSARKLWLPETPKLFEQVLNEMSGVPPSQAVKELWDINRKEFDITPYTKEQWKKQATYFVSEDASGIDVPGSPPPVGSLYPLIDLARSAGSKTQEWMEILASPVSTHTKELDGLQATSEKLDNMEWLDGRGQINAQLALNSYLLSKPNDELKNLRSYQESKFHKIIPKTPNNQNVLKLFRRYPWAESAQRQMLKLAENSLFKGEAHAAFRYFKDIQNHAENKELSDLAQVGLWLSLSQFSSAAELSKSFEKHSLGATWPWDGKRVKSEVIRKTLLARKRVQSQAPTLKSLSLKILRLPPMPIETRSIDILRNGDKVLVSSPTAMAMYDAELPTKPLWTKNHKLFSLRYTRGSAEYSLPSFVNQNVVVPYEGEQGLLALSRDEGLSINMANPNNSNSRYRFQPTGSSVVFDNKISTLQYRQSLRQMRDAMPNAAERVGEFTLCTFEAKDLSMKWSQTYKLTGTPIHPIRSKRRATYPVVNEGAIYFIANTGHIVRADCRDGKMEWMHYFRPTYDQWYSANAPSPACTGSKPIITGNKVICMPKYSGRIFALDKATGRRIWDVQRLRGHELLGLHNQTLIVIAANSLYSIDVNTGKLRWGRQIVPSTRWDVKWNSAYQLPRAQLIGSSIYCGTKNHLYRFNAENGIRLETQPWVMGSEAPITFHISEKNLYVMSNLATKGNIEEGQLISHHTITIPANDPYDKMKSSHIRSNIGSDIYYRGSLLFSIKGKNLSWCRFVSDHFNGNGQKIFQQKGNEIHINKPRTRVHDLNTGRLLSIGPMKIVPGSKSAINASIEKQ